MPSASPLPSALGVPLPHAHGLTMAPPDGLDDPRLHAIWSHSPFLLSCAKRHPDAVQAVLDARADAAFEDVISNLKVSEHGEDGPDLKAGTRKLRQAKTLAMAVIGHADLLGLWPLEQVTGALSTLADAAVEHALTLAVAEAHRRRLLTQPAKPDEAMPGLFVLGLGKLGGLELNVSSDIDIAVFYDPDAMPLADPDEHKSIAVRITRTMVDLLSGVTEDGIVFRTDLRLRPDPGSTPVAVSLPAAETYYESMGQNWERAAMIKARVMAGCRAAGDAFQSYIQPFIWRKALDPAAIRDIQSIKRQIDAHHGTGTSAVPGHNVKLGRGGIREIEFFAQTQQLMWGGRQPDLRSTQTKAALDALAAVGHIRHQTACELQDAYSFLRAVEHRIQYRDDRQDHSLPDDPDKLAAFALFCGFADADAFVNAYSNVTKTVAHHYAALFADQPPLSGPYGNLVFTGTDDDPGTVETLASMGFAKPEVLIEMVRTWHRGRYACTRSVRARQILTELVPRILHAMAQTSDPDRALMTFDAFLSQLPPGTQIFDLIQSEPSLLDRLSGILGDAPFLGQVMATQPHVIDSLLTPGHLMDHQTGLSLAQEIEALTTPLDDLEAVLDTVRRWHRERSFQAGLQFLAGYADVHRMTDTLSSVTDAAITAITDAVLRDATIPDGELAILGFGRLGAREMMIGSDLDLVMVCQTHSEDPETIAAARKASERLAQRLVAALTVPTNEGKLFEVDLRLRPQGRKGPLVATMDRLHAYYETEAWMWELQALCRSRSVYASPAMRKALRTMRQAMLARPRTLGHVTAATAGMRAKMLEALPPTSVWDAKHREGGLVTLEFLVQALQLTYGAEHPSVLHPVTADALNALLEERLLTAEQHGILSRAQSFYLTVLALLRLAAVTNPEQQSMGRGTVACLLRHCHALGLNVQDVDDVRKALQSTYASVQALFEQLVIGQADADVPMPEGTLPPAIP